MYPESKELNGRGIYEELCDFVRGREELNTLEEAWEDFSDALYEEDEVRRAAEKEIGKKMSDLIIQLERKKSQILMMLLIFDIDKESDEFLKSDITELLNYLCEVYISGEENEETTLYDSIEYVLENSVFISLSEKD